MVEGSTTVAGSAGVGGSDGAGASSGGGSEAQKFWGNVGKGVVIWDNGIEAMVCGWEEGRERKSATAVKENPNREKMVSTSLRVTRFIKYIDFFEEG